MKAAEHATTDQRRRIAKMIRSIGTAMMVTRAPAPGPAPGMAAGTSPGACGSMHGRPMATAEVADDLSTLYFATRRHCLKVDELAADSHVCLAYVDKSGKEWVSISGDAEVVDDARGRRKIAELWNMEWKLWFTGPDDPELALIRVHPHLAEYWDESSRLVVAAKIAAAAVTGRHYETSENRRIDVD